MSVQPFLICAPTTTAEGFISSKNNMYAPKALPIILAMPCFFKREYQTGLAGLGIGHEGFICFLPMQFQHKLRGLFRW
jgi:hypothetical protein